MVITRSNRQQHPAFTGPAKVLQSISAQRTPSVSFGGAGPEMAFTGSGVHAWHRFAVSFVGACALRMLSKLKAYGGGGGGYGGGYGERDSFGSRGGGGGFGTEEARNRKRKAEAESFFMYRKRLSGQGLQPVTQQYRMRKEKELFQSAHVTRGINFDMYDNISVECTGGQGTEEPIESFAQVIANYDIPEGLRENIQRCGYDKPTPVQKYAVPAALCGTDCMVSAQTGSGKTAAFLVPLVTTVLSAEPKEITPDAVQPTAVVLAPTRELCQQITTEAERLTFDTRCGVTGIYGGADAGPQLQSLAEGGDIIVASPGRLDDFLERGVINLEEVKYLVLDEADRMLDMGFEPQIRNIIEEYGMPASGRPDEGGRQTMMFSATFPQEMQDLALDFLDPAYMQISVGRVGSMTTSVEQRFLDASGIDGRGKVGMLFDALQSVKDENGDVGTAIVFTNMKVTADSVAWELNNSGFNAAPIHGGLTQVQRDRAISSLKSGRVKVLVATDVAARGLDLPGVAHVINYELPNNAEDYTHRIGRTGRIGNKGISTAFVGDAEPSLADIMQNLEDIEEDGQQIPEWLRYKSRSGGDMMRGNRFSRPSRGRSRVVR